ncbi:hypothetical protein KY290_018102 [Solanum tuberosum]|uniref:Retrotransposon gag domain-containing protein n=1 Tax=Solanum tuberosum TaxID=4113 RepID=A0ABQ7VD84_SOLTU|nr:hypothetical protein KY285_017068 [Solanum tuberosum]KAH0762029.1 hypothetical protein KY290_018102 [Solanum tuberosum]
MDLICNKNPEGSTDIRVTGNFLTRCFRLDFLRFSGQDLKTWLYKVDQFFYMDEILYNQRVKVTSIHLDGEAIAWHRLYMKARNSVVDPTWALNESYFLGGLKPELNKSVRMQAPKTLMNTYKLARLQEENLILPTPNFHRNQKRPILANTSYRKPFDNSYNKPSGFQGNANGMKLFTAADMDRKGPRDVLSL